MPRFTDQPPPESSASGYRLLRTPANHPLQGYVLSEKVEGCATHWWKNRTTPCEPPNCEACQSGISWRWHGYVVALIEPTHEIILFEFTARASKAFTDYFERHGTLRGCAFKAARVSGKNNGRVLIQCKPADLSRVTLPNAPPAHKLLAHIWNVPEPEVQPAATTARANTTRIELNPEAAPQPDHSPDTIPIGQVLAAARPDGGNNSPPNHR